MTKWTAARVLMSMSCAPGTENDIIDDVALDGDINILRLEGIDPSQILVERLTSDVQNDALIRLPNGQSIVIDGQFSAIDDTRGVQKIIFDDGSELGRDELEAMAEVVGTDASENLLGSVEDDVITAGAGDDTVSGLSGDDVYNWGAGRRQRPDPRQCACGKPDHRQSALYRAESGRCRFLPHRRR